MPTYRRAWKLYEEFQISVLQSSHISLPVLPATLALFVTHLFDRSYASSTVNTYVSALGYFHRLAGLQDPSKTFSIIEMLKGYGKIGYKLDLRLPITLPVLVRIMKGLEIFVFLSMNYLCLRPCVLWHFLHFFVLVKSQCQRGTVSMVTFYNRIKFLRNIVGMSMWFH